MYIWNRKKCIFNLGKKKKPFISGNIMKFSWKERKVICIKCRYILFWNKKKENSFSVSITVRFESEKSEEEENNRKNKKKDI